MTHNWEKKGENPLTEQPTKLQKSIIMITLEKFMSDLKSESLNEIVAASGKMACWSQNDTSIRYGYKPKRKPRSKKLTAT